jgi:hypothetical protein
MAATQAGGERDDYGKKRQASRRVRQLLRDSEREMGQRKREREREGQRRADKMTQTSRERKSLGSRE